MIRALVALLLLLAAEPASAQPGAPIAGAYVVVSGGPANSGIPFRRVITAGTGISLTDSLAANTITIANTGIASLSCSTPITCVGNAISVADGAIANAKLANASVTVTAGTGMSGGGAVALGAAVTLTNAGVTSNVAGTGIGVSGATGAVTISNTGVTSLTGTANQITASASTGAVTLSFPGGTTGTGGSAVVLATSPTITTPTIASIINTGTLTLPTATGTLGCVTLYETTTQTGTGADTTEDTLATYSMPANTFGTTGQAIHLTGFATSSNNLNVKTGKLYFGSTVLFNRATNTTNRPFIFDYWVYRTGASTQRYWGVTFMLVTGGTNFSNAGGGGVDFSAGITETDTSAIVIKFTGTNGTAAANDLVMQAFRVDLCGQ